MGRLVSLGGWGSGEGAVGRSPSAPHVHPLRIDSRSPLGTICFLKGTSFLSYRSSFQPQVRVCKSACPSTPPPTPPPLPHGANPPRRPRPKTKTSWGWGGCSLNSPEPELPRCSPSEGLVANPAPSLGRPGSGGCFGTKLEKSWATTKKES